MKPTTTLARPPSGALRRVRLPETWMGAVYLAVGVGICVGLFFLLGALGYYDVPFILRTLPSGVDPAEISLKLTSLSFGIGFLLAIPLALIRAYPPGRRGADRPTAATGGRGTRASALAGALRWPAYGLASAYVHAVRGTPFLVQVFLVYYAVLFTAPRLVFLDQPAEFWAGLLALTINTTGYQAEALRGGFQSVEPSQIEGARALGMTRFQILRRITFPQGLRLVTLPLTNEWISNFKTSAVLSYITIFELFSWSRTYVAYTLARPVEAFVMIAIFYLVINVSLSRVVGFIEARRRIPGLGAPSPEFARPLA